MSTIDGQFALHMNYVFKYVSTPKKQTVEK
jgi:hypothetical protein